MAVRNQESCKGLCNDSPSDAPEIPQLPNSTPASAAGAPTTEGGVEVFRDNRDAGSGSGGVNTAEIPSHGTPRKSPSKRHTRNSQLGNVQITITGENQIDAVPTYELAGQIQGHGLSHAGIYDNRRLVRPITVEFGSDVTKFDEKFVSDGGPITIRAYGLGDQYVESSVDLSNAAVASAGAGVTNRGGDTRVATGSCDVARRRVRPNTGDPRDDVGTRTSHRLRTWLGTAALRGTAP